MTMLGPEEIGSLMDAISSANHASDDTLYAPFDLTNPERSIPEPMPQLEAAHEHLARAYANALVGRTRRRLRILPGRITKVRADELREMVNPPAVIAVVELGGTDRTGLILLGRALADELVMAGLGIVAGRDFSGVSDDDAFTPLERVVLRRLLQLFEGPMQEAYRGIASVRPRVVAIETDPRLALDLSPTEVGLCSVFEVSGELTGEFRLILPFSILEPSRKHLIKKPRPMPPPFDSALQKTLSRHVNDMTVPVIARLGATWAHMQDLRSLGAGDVISLDTDERAPISICVGGREKLLGRPLVDDGWLAFEVVQFAKRGLSNAPPEMPLALSLTPALAAARASSGIQLGISRTEGLEGPRMSDAEAMRSDGSLTNDMAWPGAHTAEGDDPMENTDAPGFAAATSGVNIDDVPVQIVVELGRTSVPIADVLGFTVGTVVRLSKPAGDDLDIYVNGRLIARGEAVVVGERFGVRITSVVSNESSGREQP
jgi:flagellar motor switch protein FliM